MFCGVTWRCQAAECWLLVMARTGLRAGNGNVRQRSLMTSEQQTSTARVATVSQLEQVGPWHLRKPRPLEGSHMMVEHCPDFSSKFKKKSAEVCQMRLVPYTSWSSQMKINFKEIHSAGYVCISPDRVQQQCLWRCLDLGSVAVVDSTRAPPSNSDKGGHSHRVDHPNWTVGGATITVPTLGRLCWIW